MCEEGELCLRHGTVTAGEGEQAELEAAMNAFEDRCGILEVEETRQSRCTHDIGEENVSRAEISSRLRETTYSEDAINMALKQLEVRRLLTRIPVERQIQRRLAQPNGWEPTLISKDYAYAISFDLLRRWVARKHPLGSLLSTT